MKRCLGVARYHATAITGVALAESGAFTGESFNTTLTDTNGLLSVISEGGASVSGAGTKSLTISGTFAGVNATLATLTENEPTSAADTLVINATDNLGGSGSYREHHGRGNYGDWIARDLGADCGDDRRGTAQRGQDREPE